MPVSTETQLPNLSSTLVERLARREMERGEGRSGLKTRLRRWVGTSTSRRRPRESRPMEERGHHIEQEVTEQLKLSIDSGIDLELLSSMPTTRPGMEEEQSLDFVQPTPILRSTRKRCGVKKSISFSDGQSRTMRWVGSGTLNLGALIICYFTIMKTTFFFQAKITVAFFSAIILGRKETRDQFSVRNRVLVDEFCQFLASKKNSS